MADRYPAYFVRYIQRAAQLELLTSELTRYDLENLCRALAVIVLPHHRAG